MSEEMIEYCFKEGVRNAQTLDELSAAFAWREFQLKHRILGPLLDALANVAATMFGVTR